MDIMYILGVLASALTYPGLATLWIISMFSEWWVRKLTARAQRRMGPTYVGPLGVLQPFADFIKLLVVKSESSQRYGNISLAKAFAFVGIGALVASTLLLPISPYSIYSRYDLILLIYFFGVWVALSEVVIAISIPNPFTLKGASRYASVIALCEPAFFLSLLIPAYLTAKVLKAEPTWSITAVVSYAPQLWLNPLTLIPMLLSLISILVATQSKLMLPPFNIPEAEQEVIAGPTTELSGPLLALFNFIHDADLAISSLIITLVFLVGPYPFESNPALGALTTIVKFLLVLTVITVIRASFGRFRLEQGLKTIVKYSITPGLIGLAIALIM